MHITAIIPARYASTRLPAKPLCPIAGKTLVQRVFEAVQETALFDKVIVATDHSEIYEHCKSFGADVRMTSADHKSGSDRIAQCAKELTTDLVVNVQGDEPFICRAPLEELIKAFDDSAVQVGSLMHIIKNPDDISNPNCVKVVVDKKENALYFSRSPIPHSTLLTPHSSLYYKHIGVYAFRPAMLQTFVSLPQGKLEQAERLEQLRLLENGIKIKMVLTEYSGIGIDTAEDVRKAECRIQKAECSPPTPPPLTEQGRQCTSL